MSKMILAGPPWCQFVDEDEAYVRGQLGQVGSGLLSGVDVPEHVVTEIRDEVRKIVARRAAGRHALAESPTKAISS